MEECIGVNSKPKSSELARMATGEGFRSVQKAGPDKIVLLNHMMKPITCFNSTEL